MTATRPPDALAAPPVPPRRIEAARAALEAYRASRGYPDAPDSDAIDLCVDVLHWLDATPPEPGEPTRYAPDIIHRLIWRHYDEERNATT